MAGKRKQGHAGDASQAELEQVIEKQRRRIEELEKINEMHDRAEEFSRQERIDAERMIEAREQLQNLSERERLAAEKTIRAQEELQRLAEKERREADRIIRAQEEVQHLSESERLQAEKTIQAQEELQHLSESERLQAAKTIQAQEELQRLAEKERREADRIIRAQEELQHLSEIERLQAEKTIQAQEKLQRLAEEERREADRIIRAQEELQHLSEIERLQAEEMLAAHDRIEMLTVSEIKQRDAVLAAILSMNSRINSLQPVDDLLEHTLLEACRLFSANRGFVARYIGANMAPIARAGFVCKADADSLLDAILVGRSVSGLHAKLSREGRTIGLLYLERNSCDDSFSYIDREFLEILASQLSVGFNNSLLYNRLRQQNRELRRMIMLKNSFIEHLSSDLQRPLNKLIDMITDETGSKQKEAVTLAQWLRRTVDKVMSVTALQQEVDEMYLHSIRLDVMVKEIVQALQDEIDKRRLTVEYEFPEVVTAFEGNQDIIHTIMDEVICNAIVYNRDGGVLKVVITKDSQFCHITVIDTGVGIRKDELDKVFERFYRAGTSQDLYNRGAGLGLYIVRNFIETYGGSISLSSIEGKGTEVALSFPI